LCGRLYRAPQDFLDRRGEKTCADSHGVPLQARVHLEPLLQGAEFPAARFAMWSVRGIARSAFPAFHKHSVNVLQLSLAT